ncbi:hypothetical protein BDF21DRAFT_375356 [Thamnidium elegans]|uniref:Kinesin motor domain-containing protein n=1 Tax=Thamnidium elegans TaxID=101142 RepID=A0A8H7SSR5_9FUNG|nr:hypothetical protein INT48_000490 [Thamnidium elegans]KAI8094301.1 hypothetical protein BDF21DRAFT_375356 [Thamnidium elegans]
MTSTAVRVGLRVRPLTQKEQLLNCTECISFIPNEPQILVGTDKSFTYDYVFNNDSEQQEVYQKAASPLLEKFIEGFNATILAYGQTGSGKTFSMGTGLESTTNPEHEGIVPRCILDLFRNLEQRSESNQEFKYEVYVSFLELYNEELIDLLSPHHQHSKKKTGANIVPTVEVTIREDVAGNIYWSGVREEKCENPDELLQFLAKGSLCRTTGSTEMNTVSSRSHAVFSVILKQQKSDQDPSITSKFHFVDLAGSERLKRTNAQGDRAREGISINSGLLALGNVISALGDDARRTSHVPYRDSKLTRLLQDSLGGNSQTLMLACVSPSDSNFMETLNTLKYANRARNIKNRVTINQDFAGSSIEVNQLRAQLARLRIELASVRAESSGAGDNRSMNTRTNNGGNLFGSSYQRDDEVRALRSEVARLRDRIQDMSTNIIQITSERDTMVMERELGEFMNDHAEGDDFIMTTSRRNSAIADADATVPVSQNSVKTHPLVAQYQKTIQDLTNELSDTRDRLTFIENSKSAMHTGANTPMSFSGTTFYQPETSLSTSSRRRNNNNNKQNSRRGRRPRNASANSSTVTSSITARKTKRSVRIAPVLSQSSSLRTSRKNRSQPKNYLDDEDDDQDEGYINEDVDEEEIKQSIAKAKAEIQKGMEVLDLIKPMEDATQSWEDELEAFEKAERAMYERTSQIERSESDEGVYTSSSSPVDDSHRDLDLLMEIEALSVPSWDHKSTTTSNRKSKSSFDDDEEASSASSLNSTLHRHEFANMTSHEKQNPQMVRMLHQIQSDIRVKEELVSHLEKSETKFSFMRRKFDEKVSHLHSQLAELQNERDHALAKTKSNFAAAPNRADVTMQMKEKQQLIETRHVYENKMKQLVLEIHDLKRNYSRTISTMQSTRNQHESLLRSLRVNVETLKVEKKRMIKRMKQETERVREQMALQERKISKLQRQHTEVNHARSRLEREHEAQKLTLKRRDKEILISTSQLKQLTDMLKKAVREGGVLDDFLLSKVSHIMGGSFAAVARRGGMRNLPGFQQVRKRKNPIPIHVRVARKKQLLDKMLYQFIQGKQAIVEMEQILFRRERLSSEKIELLDERKSIFMAEKETAELTGEPMDMLAIDLADERIDLIEAEISYLTARIKALQSEAAGESDELSADSPDGGRLHEKRKVTFADEIVSDPPVSDEWTDMDALEEQFNVPSNAAPEMVYDFTLKLLKTLEADECRSITEALVDDISNVRMSECNRQITMQNLEKSVQDLRRTLIVMKRAAIATTVENERRIRKLEEKNNGTIKSAEHLDNKIEDYIMNSGNTIFDKIYEDGLRGMIGTPEPDYMLAESPDEASVSTASFERRSSTQSEGLIPPPSPLTLPTYASTTTNNANNLMLSPTRPPTSTGIRAPAALTEKGGVMRVNNSNYPTRDLTPSPDRFYNMIQKRLSWQQRAGGSESPIPMTMVNPAEFVRYANDRESSTSSIHSGHLRRASLQSDYSSSQNSYGNTSGPSTISSTQSSLRKRSSSVLQPPAQPQQLQQQARRRASLRELSLKGINGTPMTHTSSTVSHMMEYDYEAPTPSMSFQRTSGQQTPQHLKRPPMVSASTMVDRASTPTGHNVFARLSQTPTRASQAKISHRHSSSSMDDLRQRWELERTSSAMSGSFYGD